MTLQRNGRKSECATEKMHATSVQYWWCGKELEIENDHVTLTTTDTMQENDSTKGLSTLERQDLRNNPSLPCREDAATNCMSANVETRWRGENFLPWGRA
jgi:hypothetical protein